MSRDEKYCPNCNLSYAGHHDCDIRYRCFVCMAGHFKTEQELREHQARTHDEENQK